MCRCPFSKLGVTAVIAVLLAGCFPQDSIRWSRDGSVGVGVTSGTLFRVDGQTGRAVRLEENYVEPGPDISRDGRLICYAKSLDFTSFAEAESHLSAEMLSALEADAQKVLAGHSKGRLLAETVDRVLKGNESYRDWVRLFLYERYRDAAALTETDRLDDNVHLYKLILCETADPAQKRLLACSFKPLGFPRFSPDAALVGYLVEDQELEQVELWVTGAAEDHPACRVDDRTAFLFDWSEDGRRVAYMQSAMETMDEPALGSLCERTVRDAQGNLLCAPQADGRLACTGGKDERAGVLFSPLLKVEYGPGGRLFFSSAKLTLPAGTLEDPEWSIFCFDPLTQTVAEILPPEGRRFGAENLILFSLSPDGQKLLWPNGENNVFVYDMAKKDLTQVVGEGFSAEEDWPDLIPAWKGSDAISVALAEGAPEDPNALYGVYNLKGDLILTIRPEDE